MTVTDFGFPAEEEGGRRRGEGGGGALRDIYRVLLSLIVSYFFRLSLLFSFFFLLPFLLRKSDFM